MEFLINIGKKGCGNYEHLLCIKAKKKDSENTIKLDN